MFFYLLACDYVSCFATRRKDMAWALGRQLALQKTGVENLIILHDNLVLIQESTIELHNIPGMKINCIQVLVYKVEITDIIT